MNRLACWAAILAIRLYQLFGRGLVQKECIYSPSCSCRAIAFFRRGPFLVALLSTRQQLARCNGNYSLRLNGHREVEMVTDDGEVVHESELAPRVTRKLKRFAPAMPPVDA